MLSVRGLRAGYSGKAVASLPTLDIGNGEVTLLRGPSGSGKTTLLLAIAGLAQIIAGEVNVGGVAVQDLRSLERDRFRGRTIGLVFQDVNLLPGLTSLQNVMLAPFAVAARQDRARARKLLAELGVGGTAKQQAETLSRGQAQRVALARAMLMRPKLILADEPTASLDPAACRTVAALLRRAAEETNAALVIATHDERLQEVFKTSIAVEAPE